MTITTTAPALRADAPPTPPSAGLCHQEAGAGTRTEPRNGTSDGTA